MSWLVVSWFLALGWVPEQGTGVHGRTEILEAGRVATVAQIGIDAEIYKRFHVFADFENYQYFDNKVFFDPYRIDYSIGASFQVNEWVSITLDHECDHPVNANTFTSYESSETKIIAKITGKSRF